MGINYTTSAPLLIQAKLLQMVADGIDPAIIQQEVEDYLQEHGNIGTVDAFIYDRNSIVAATWIIDHNLNKYPQVTLIGEDDNKMDADIHYGSLNQVTVSFAEPTAGKAVLL